MPKMIVAGMMAADMEKITEPIELEFGLYPCLILNIRPVGIFCVLAALRR